MSNWWCIQMSSRAEPSSSLGMTLSCARHQVHLHPCRSTRRPGSGPYPGQISRRPHSSTIWVLVKKQDVTRMYIYVNICRLITDSKTMDHRVDHTRCNIVALRDRGLGGSEPSGWNQTSPPMMNRAIRSAPPQQSFCYASAGHWTWKAESLRQSTVCISMPCQSEWWVEETLNLTTNVASRLFFIQKQASSKGFLLPTAPAQEMDMLSSQLATLYQPWFLK